jgi:hypothetical protein
MGCFNSKPVYDELLKINKRLDDISLHINSMDESVYYIEKKIKKKYGSKKHIRNTTLYRHTDSDCEYDNNSVDDDDNDIAIPVKNK